MGANKISLVRIANERKRKSTLRRRKRGLFKKLAEFSTLCNAEVGAIIYSPGEEVPTVWPSLPEVGERLRKFQTISNPTTSTKLVTQYSYVQDKYMKDREKLQQSKQKNDEKEMAEIVNQLLEGETLDQLDARKLNLAYVFIGEKMKALQTSKHGSNLKKDMPISSSLPPPHVAPPLHPLLSPNRISK